MSDQLSLLDAPRNPPTVRSTDPVTAVVGSKSVDEAARKAEVLKAMWKIGLCNSSARSTASEIHRVARDSGSLMEIGSVRSRLNQLSKEDPPRVRRTTGVRVVSTEDGGTGRPEQVWDFTEQGLRETALMCGGNR